MMNAETTTSAPKNTALVVSYGSGTVNHSLEMYSEIEITPTEARKAQLDRGFHPDGYGFHRFSCKEIAPGLWHATWECYSNAD